MKDHIQWRANWLGPRSEYDWIERHYEREERRHAVAALLGALTAALCAAAFIAYFATA